MSDRFPQIRPQATMNGKARSVSRALPTPAPVDLTILAALVLAVVLMMM
ncbi:MAG: hypothetical protein V4753_17265 [Pseudomonadota bacterium]